MLEYASGRIRRIVGNATARTVSTFAGSSAIGAAAEANSASSPVIGKYTYPALVLSGGHQMVFDNVGNLYYADS